MIAEELGNLPIEPPPATGESIDGFKLTDLLADGRYARVFRATDEHSSRDLVLKIPKPGVLAEPPMRPAFLREQLLGMRVASPFVCEVITLTQDWQTLLYTVVPDSRRVIPANN